MSGAIGPSVRTPEIATLSSFNGWSSASVTAETSKPLWTMQSAHFS